MKTPNKKLSIVYQFM